MGRIPVFSNLSNTSAFSLRHTGFLPFRKARCHSRDPSLPSKQAYSTKIRTDDKTEDSGFPIARITGRARLARQHTRTATLQRNVCQSSASRGRTTWIPKGKWHVLELCIVSEQSSIQPNDFGLFSSTGMQVENGRLSMSVNHDACSRARELFEAALSDYIIIMKYAQIEGTANDSVILDKAADLLSTGSFMWGYNGTVCNPEKQVAPLIDHAVSHNQDVFLVLARTKTTCKPGRSFATKRSRDGREWEPMPEGVRASGSRFALSCDSLTIQESIINLADYKVALGPNAGRPLSAYLHGRNTKACAVKSSIRQPEFLPFAIQAFARVTDAYYLL